MDLTIASDAILTKIFKEIASCAAVVADISAIDRLGDWPVRNAKVLYEVGIAHASRSPEEVMLLRSDVDALAFYVAGVRVHGYDPYEDPATARDTVSSLLVDSLQSLSQRRRLATDKVAERLSLPAVSLLLHLVQEPSIPHPPTDTPLALFASAERRAAIERLLTVGAIRTDLIKLTPKLLARPKDDAAEPEGFLSYSLTPFGRALVKQLTASMGLSTSACVALSRHSCTARPAEIEHSRQRMSVRASAYFDDAYSNGGTHLTHPR